MIHIIPATKKLVVGLTAVGLLSLGAAGAAGAASATPTTGATPTTPALTHFNCANATKALTRIQKVDARIAGGLPKITAAEAKATTNGKTKRAARLKKVATRLESARFKDRLARRASAIEAKCNVPAPAASTTGS